MCSAAGAVTARRRVPLPHAAPLVALVSLVAVAACGGGHRPTAVPSTAVPSTAASAAGEPSSAAPSPAPTAAASAAPPSAAAPPGAPAAQRPRDLAGVVLPAPQGYVTSTSADVNNGPITPAQFDQLTTGAGAALGFTGGYQMTYDSTDPKSSDYIDISLATFATGDAAASGTRIFIDAFLGGNTDQSPTQHPFAAIAGAIELEGTKLSKDGLVDHLVVAAKGNAIMGFDFVADHLGPSPSAFAAWAAAQYARL